VKILNMRGHMHARWRRRQVEMLMLFKSIETTTHALLVACKGQTLSLATCDSVDMFNTSAAPGQPGIILGSPLD